MRISEAAFDMIVEFEVSSKQTYERKYRRPEWPGVQSGVTVGIGYDLGQTPADTVRSDWQGRVPAEMLAAMLSACGTTGAAARGLTEQLRDQIDIPWETAIRVHSACVIPRWELRLSRALPNTDRLSGDSLGALLSLIFNRGTSFDSPGDRYAEMRAIKAHMATGEFDKIPDDLRSMKRIWPGVPGLQKRRDREADLFARGIGKPATKPIVNAERAGTGTVIVATGGAAKTASDAGLSDNEIAAIIIGGFMLALAAFFLIRKFKKQGA